MLMLAKALTHQESIMLRNQSHIALEGPVLSVQCVALARDTTPPMRRGFCVPRGE
jgi:hypothetical protein